MTQDQQDSVPDTQEQQDSTLVTQDQHSEQYREISPTFKSTPNKLGAKEPTNTRKVLTFNLQENSVRYLDQT